MAPKKATGNTTRDATKAANASLDIDFGTSKSANELAVEKAQTRGVWINKLVALNEGIYAGKGELDKFYRIGTFSTPSGARTVIRTLSKNPDALPGEFVLEPRIVVTDGKRTSELWACVPSEDFDAAAEPADA